MIIPFFIPHAGCPHQCVFCNQKNITGEASGPDPERIPDAICTFLTTDRGRRPVQVAFYGGSFTALPISTQKSYLEAARPFIQSGQVESLRISTRPDAIDADIVSFLGNYHVKTVELGAQSMHDEVLSRSGRGHTVSNTVLAARLLRSRGFSVGLQLMPGLPGDSAGTFQDTVSKVLALKPDFVRIYPALVIAGTPLADQFRAGLYTPLSVDDAVAWCREALARFAKAGVDVIRVGLQPTRVLESTGAVLAGPYHPAFRQLVESSLYLDAMRRALREFRTAHKQAVFHVHPADVSTAVGQLRTNIRAIEQEFGFQGVRIEADKLVHRGAVELHG